MNVTATGSDINVRGSGISSTGNTTLTAARDVILESAQNMIATQSKSSNVGGGISFTVAVGVTGIRGMPSAGISGSKSSASSNEVTQANTNVTAGGTLNLTTGRDATLKGAVVQGQNVVASIGRDLSIESLQDTSTAKSKSIGGSLSISGKSLNGKGLADAVGARDTGNVADDGDGKVGSAGVSASLSASKSKSNSNIVSEQSALIARGGSLSATVTGNTGLKGGVIAALDNAGKDTGRLALTTATLTASDIKDSAKSKSIGIGVSANINKPGEEGQKGADLPVVDGSFASSTFKQDTKPTIGHGTLTVGVPNANVTINRDVGASQVVTKDKSTGFTVYADPAAIREVIALARGDQDNSTILQGVAAVKADLDGNPDTRSPLAQEVRDLATDLEETRKVRAIKNNSDLTIEEKVAAQTIVAEAQFAQKVADANIAALPPEEREAARPKLEAEARKLAKTPEAQTFIREGVIANVQRDFNRTAARRALTPDERSDAASLARGAQLIDSGINSDGEIVVNGNLVKQSDRELLRSGDTSIVDRTAQAVRPITQVGGGTVKGTGTGLINNAKDTVGLIGDAVGFGLNKVSGGLVYKEAAGRTSGRIDAAGKLIDGLRNDPVTTGRKLGESFVAPFTKARDQLAAGQTFEGTATATEAGADLIVKAATGGSKFIAGILTGGLPGIMKKVDLPDVPSLDDLARGANLPDRGGLTLGGRALQKHGSREGSAFPEVKGNPESINLQAQAIVDGIINDPGSTVTTAIRGRFGKVIEVFAPDGRGLRFSADGKLIGLLEPKR